MRYPLIVKNQLYANTPVMKKVILLSLTAALALSASAQSKFSTSTRQIIESWQASVESRAGMKSVAKEIRPLEADADNITVMVMLHSEDDAETLSAAGFDVVSVYGTVALVNSPIADLERMAGLPQVIEISAGEENRPMLSKARPASEVTPVLAGTDLPKAFDGTGVVCGLMDTGLDPNHVNFRDADGTGDTRVKAVYVLSASTSTTAAVTSYTTPARIAQFTTENSDQTHGTHVLGIMSGAYKGAGVYGTLSTSGNAMQGKKNIPYYGVAPGSDIVVCCGSLYDPCILRAAELVMDYAEQNHKPAVLNISLGSNTGPHDGTTSFNTALAALGKRGIICVSSGNEGEDPVYIFKQFTAGSTEVKTFIPLTNGAYTGRYEVYGRNATVFPLQFVVYDTTDSKIVYSYNLNRNLAGGSYGIGSSAYSNYSDIDETPDAFDAVMTGYVKLWSNVSTTNNRYNVTISLSCTPKDSRYVAGLVCTGTAGSIVEFYSGTGFTSRGIAGWTNGTPNNSANNLACGDNVLAIGSYTSRNSWPNYGGGLVWLASNQTYAETYYPVGKISPFSSYGQEINGKNIPTICAPGCYLVSSISTPYFNKAGLVNASVVGVAESTIANTETTRQNYWDGMMGTSMASPFAAGVCALMLQADPTLTFDKVHDILTSTAVRDEDVTSATNQVQWGAGKVDALAAVKKVLAQSSAIGSVRSDDMSWNLLPSAAGYDLIAPGAESIDAAIYDMQGRCVMTAKTADCQLSITTSGLTPGVYLLRASSAGSSHTAKIVVR